MINGTATVDRSSPRRMFAVRRLFVLSGVMLGLLAPSAASATISSVFGTVTCTTQGPGASEGQRWCGNTANTTVTSFDGTPIDVSVAFPPAAEPDTNYPVVGIYHGWGGSKITPSSATSQRWLKLGYATFSVSDRGWGSSCGGPSKPANTLKAPPCERGYIHLMSRAYEVRDVQYLLGKLADEGVINPQEIGATGGSYGGGMSLQLGSLKDRVQLPSGELVPWQSPEGKPMKIAATAPEFPWTDLAQSLQPNGSNLDYVAEAPYKGMLGNHEFGIQKRNWNESLFNAGAVLGYYAPTSAADPEANLVEWNTFNSTGGPYNGKPLAIQQEEVLPNHAPYYTNMSEPPAPALMENGWNDDLFPVDQTVDYYNKIRSAYPNQPVQLFDLDLGHNPRSSTTPSTTDVGKLVAAQNAWFEYFIKGQGGEPAKAHGGVTAITSVCPATSGSSGAQYKASNWASLAPGEIRLEGAAEQTIQAPGTAPATAFTTGTNVCSTQAAGNNASAATYKLAPAPAEGFTIAGSSTVVAEISTPSENDQIIARLYDVNEGAGGTQQLIGRAIYRPISPGGGFTKQVFQLHPQAWKVAAGHVVKLELLVQDSNYARTSSSPASMQVKNLELRIPTIEQPGSDGGLVQGPQPKYLPPGYTLAHNDSPPAVVTGAASSIEPTSAMLNATVNPEGVTVTSCQFEYGTTEAYGTSVPCSSLPGSGESPIGVSAELSPGSLTENTTYHFRITATSANGASSGADVMFTTPKGVTSTQLCGPPNSPGGQGTAGVCNWYANSGESGTSATARLDGFHVVLLWGTLVENSAAGEVTCKVVAFGTTQNPAPLGKTGGIGLVWGFTSYGCESPQCVASVEAGHTAVATLTAANLPWKQSLGEGGIPTAVRDTVGAPFSLFGSPSPGAMAEKYVCEDQTTHTAVLEAIAEGQLEPEIGIGTGPPPGLNSFVPVPSSTMRFTGPSSGSLEFGVKSGGSYTGDGQDTWAGSLNVVPWVPVGSTIEVW